MEEFYTVAMLISILTFTLSSGLTPGPNNIMVLSSGLTFGLRRTTPHMMGIIIGFPIMVLLIGLGMGSIFERFPIVLTVLKYVGLVYLFWMAYKIASNKSTYDLDENTTSKPFTFMQSALFQWVNPKAWIMAITSISLFVSSGSDSFIQVCIVTFLYFLTAIFTTYTWAFGGVFLKKFIKNEYALRVFNITMALFLVASVVPLIFNS